MNNELNIPSSSQQQYTETNLSNLQTQSKPGVLQKNQTANDSQNDKKKLMEKIRNKKLSKQSKSRSNNKNNEVENGMNPRIGKYEVDLECRLGRGTFGQVYKAHLIERPDEVFACKIISKGRLQKEQVYDENSGKSLIQRLDSQIEIHKQLSESKHIVKLYDFIKIDNLGYYLFMQMCDIDLAKFIKQRGHLSQIQAMDMFKQLLKGYKFMYDRGISHRDLKPENLLLMGKNLKISDFGFVKVHASAELILRSAQKNICLAESLVGTINYIAPDILLAENQKKKYNPFKSDVWSMGIILFKMLFGKQPYQAYKTTDLLQKILSEPLIFPQSPPISTATRTLLCQLIQKDDTKRILFKTLYLEIIGEQSQQKQAQIPSSSLYSDKERMLVFYNLLITKISYDSAHHATLREIGIPQYHKFSYRLMIGIHEKRMHILVKAGKDINGELKKDILSYNQVFHEAIKQSAESDKNTENLLQLLQKYKDYLKEYNEFEMLHQQVQYFLLLLLLFYNMERGYVTMDYIYTIIQKEKNSKLNLKKLEELTKKNLDYK